MQQTCQARSNVLAVSFFSKATRLNMSSRQGSVPSISTGNQHRVGFGDTCTGMLHANSKVNKLKIQTEMLTAQLCQYLVPYYC